MRFGAGFGVLVSGCSTVELPSKQVLPQATARARARAQDDEAAGVGARLPSSSSSSSTSQPGPKSRCLQLEQENVSRHLDDLGPTHLDLASPCSPPPRLNAALGARLPSSSSSSSTTQPGPKSRCHQPEPENTSRHLDDLGPIHLDHASPRSTPPRLDAAMTWLCSSHLNFIAALGFNSVPLGSALPLRTNESS